jgi:hypothetical protein
MDIAGAKALKKRLGPRGADDAPPAADRADVPADAPPVYQWTGVNKAEAETPPSVEDDEPATRRASWFRRLALSLR